jgi:hypothetical protein
MARGKYLNLEEARREKKLQQFAKEHPSEGDEAAFDRLFNAMASGKPAVGNRTSDEGNSEG